MNVIQSAYDYMEYNILNMLKKISNTKIKSGWQPISDKTKKKCHMFKSFVWYKNIGKNLTQKSPNKTHIGIVIQNNLPTHFPCFFLIYNH